MDVSFYRQFHLILSGLDNIEARRYVNSLVVSLAEVDDDGNVDPSTIIPLLDGGTEGLRGQARVIIPRITRLLRVLARGVSRRRARSRCARSPRRRANPRTASRTRTWLQWPKAFPEKKLDKDRPSTCSGCSRPPRSAPEQYGIAGVTYSLTLAS
ncbi:hypothetical protein PINS_up023552 [Pythium insidiosum]|nr:hypothetical protein PINS_up023552 [Pythium insidiosum]